MGFTLGDITGAAATYAALAPAQTVANLKNPLIAGPNAKDFVTDATATTFGTVVVGGGANKVPVWCDGTAWKIG